MNLHRLEIFLAVADTGGFSRAADAMLLTQSTVSQHIASLETELGTPLFDRTGRGAELTEGGALFYRHARRILLECSELRQLMADFRGLETARLSVGASNIPGNYLIPELLPALLARHPGISLNVMGGDSQEVLERLLRGEISLAIVGRRCNDEELVSIPLLGDTLLLVVGAGHPWRERQEVTLDELAAMPLVVRESGSGSGRTIEDALQAAGVDSSRLRIIARLGSNEAARQAVLGGIGAAFLSSLSIQRELALGELTTVRIKGLAIERRFWLAMRRGRALSPAAQAFSALLTERYGANGATASSLEPAQIG